jgi:hypothetical protein
MIDPVEADIFATAARDGSIGVRPVGMNFPVLAVLGVFALAGCSTPKPEALPDPNTYPTNYRADIVNFLRMSLSDRALFRGAMIAQPVLKPIGDSQRYMVCVQLNSHGQILNKVAVYVGGRLQEFVDSTPDQCGAVAYSSFPELAAATPAM